VLPGSGIVKAKGEGRYKGRKATARAKSADIGLTKQGMAREKIANEDGVGVASVYRALKATAAVGETR
jgi:DNA invertase Pin-like site-specific DNA recombinase